MPDDMFFVADRRSLRRGRRVAQRTETCRPCMIWLKSAPEVRHPGVAMDVSPHGMRVRMMAALPMGSAIIVQMMRDDEFEMPLTAPIEATVARTEPETDGFVDHGIQLIRKEIKRTEVRPVPAGTNRPVPRAASRVYKLDVVVGDRGLGRKGR